MVWRQLTHRAGRSLALALAVVVAGTGFTVLTASSKASTLATTNLVRKQARTSYDILVRPKGSRSALERSESVVQPGFLTGDYGGITMQQWHTIQQLSGVQVAAPVAVVGYVYPTVLIPVSVKKAWSRRGDSVARVDVTWSWDNGLTQVKQVPDFAFVTSKRLGVNANEPVDTDGEWRVNGAKHGICRVSLRSEMRPEKRDSTLVCFSRTAGGDGTKYGYKARKVHDGILVTYPLPYVVAAVDPASEDALVGLDQARTSGHSLEGASIQDPNAATGEALPVLMADGVQTQETATVTVSRLGKAAADLVATNRGNVNRLRDLPAHPVTQRTITAQEAQQTLASQFATITQRADRSLDLPGQFTEVGQVSLPRIDTKASPPSVELTRPSMQYSGSMRDHLQFQAPGSDEPAARSITTSTIPYDPMAGTGPPAPTTLHVIGAFDATKLDGLGDLTDQILAGYDAAPTTGADARSRRLLGDRPLRPSPYLGGFVQPPPMMVTSLKALPLVTEGWVNSNETAPISAIRVRVSGVSGVDASSRERVRLAAQRIQARTGLDVDIVDGSSPVKQTLVLPAGSHGRPTLSLSQWWVKKGVALTVISAVDKKSLVLFILVLLISALSVANAAVSSVRSRRGELGVLACLGWRPRHLFRIVLTEIAVIGLSAGVVSGLLSYAVGRFIHPPVSLDRAALAIPAGLLVALVAGIVPAVLAARADPMDAVEPVVSEPKKAHQPRSLFALARTGVGRVKARTALAAVGLGVAVLVFTVLLAISLAFQGAVVGSVLGDAVAIQARGADYAATGASLLLAFLGVANVIYLNVRDRGPELATLRAVGWTERHLSRLIITEGILVGALGATPGVILGLVTAAGLTGTITLSFVVGAIIAWAVAVLLAALAAAAATRLVVRLPTTLLLTE